MKKRLIFLLITFLLCLAFTAYVYFLKYNSDVWIVRLHWASLWHEQLNDYCSLKEDLVTFPKIAKNSPLSLYAASEAALYKIGDPIIIKVTLRNNGKKAIETNELLNDWNSVSASVSWRGSPNTFPCDTVPLKRIVLKPGQSVSKNIVFKTDLLWEGAREMWFTYQTDLGQISAPQSVRFGVYECDLREVLSGCQPWIGPWGKLQ